MNWRFLHIRDKSICYGVTERHECQSDEGGNSVSNILPIDARDLAHHHAANLLAVSISSICTPEKEVTVQESMYSQLPKVEC
jgi:hypothetical protein